MPRGEVSGLVKRHEVVPWVLRLGYTGNVGVCSLGHGCYTGLEVQLVEIVVTVKASRGNDMHVAVRDMGAGSLNVWQGEKFGVKYKNT